MSSKLSLEKEVTVSSLFGHQVVPEEIVLAGMKDLENHLNETFKRAQEQHELAARHTKVLQQSFLAPMDKDEKHIEAVKALKEISIRHSEVKAKAPEFTIDKQRIFTGSIGATVAPPYNYQWTWHTSSGTVDVLNTGATAGNGHMNLDIDSNNQCSCSARTAVGIFFRPMTSDGILRVSANPAINFNWFDICAFDSTHSDGFIGLYVGRYNLSGGFDGAPVNQQIGLWNDSSWWSGGSNSGDNTGFPLSSQFNVDSSHWYALWVWCGGNINCDGWGTFSGSGAGATLSVVVPSITWELF